MASQRQNPSAGPRETIAEVGKIVKKTGLHRHSDALIDLKNDAENHDEVHWRTFVKLISVSARIV